MTAGSSSYSTATNSAASGRCGGVHGHNCGHGVTHVPDRPHGQRRVRDLLGVGNRPADGQRPQLVGELLAGEDRDDPVDRLRTGRVDALDSGVRVGTAHQDHVQQTDELDIVDEVPVAGYQSRVLSSLDAGSEYLGGHRALLGDVAAEEGARPRAALPGALWMMGDTVSHASGKGKRVTDPDGVPATARRIPPSCPRRACPAPLYGAGIHKGVGGSHLGLTNYGMGGMGYGRHAAVIWRDTIGALRPGVPSQKRVSDCPVSLGTPMRPRGAVAHLGERFNGIEEVGGSSPPSSTSKYSAPCPLLSQNLPGS